MERLAAEGSSQPTAITRSGNVWIRSGRQRLLEQLWTEVRAPWKTWSKEMPGLGNGASGYIGSPLSNG